ncbi:putative bifunctional diguanylate cyclase/phosphodiesterase [Methylobacterium oryzisoli]|uniref:putative bifunctional diguanylate cyclase/phosphodiesterase n=1 Tax=Methylobacterium oryzisoli TaxID=3385502 RepID=UPI0038916C1A
MYRLLTCITDEHIPGLLALNGLIGLATAYTLFALMADARRGPLPPTRYRLARQLVVGVAAGGGMWSTHVLGMLAYDPAGISFGFEAASMALAFGLGILLVCGTLAIARSPRAGAPALAAALLALGFAGLHVLGLEGTVVPGRVVWDLPLAAAAVAAGTGLSALAMTLGLRRTGLPARLAASVLLTLGICGMHVLALAAATVVPDAGVVVPALIVPREAAAWCVAAACALLLHLAAHSLVADARAAALEVALERLRGLTEAAFEGIAICRDGAVLDVNPSFCGLVGRSAASLRGESLDALTEPGSPPLRAACGTGEDPRSVETLLRRAGGAVPVEVRAKPWRDGTYVLAVNSLREQREADQRLRQIAVRDLATGLPNRVAFDAALRTQITACVRSNAAFALHRIDLDRFKDINVVIGHAAADQVLATLAKRLVQGVESGTLDRVFRLGDDEFAVIQVGTGPQRSPEAVALQIVEHLSAPVVVADRQVPVSVSVGIAVWPEDGSGAEMLLRRSGLALDRAKLDGGSRHCRFDESLVGAIEARRALQADLAEGLRADAFSVVYLPVVSFATRGVVGHEALLRWRHPVLGEIPPSRFIPLAEASGAIVDLGRFVLREACRAAVSWEGAPLVCVNVSGVQLRTDEIVTLVDATLAETGLPPQRLQLDVTETILIDDRHRIAQRLEALRRRGIRVALDDFGKGLSSLQLPRDIPFDAVKLDVSVIRSLLVPREQRGVVEAMIRLLHQLGRVIVAEGVETKEQWDVLQRAGCDFAQGSLFGTPRPAPITGDVLLESLPQVTRLADHARRRQG